jgi:uncharacterized membrane protein YGL010W
MNARERRTIVRRVDVLFERYGSYHRDVVNKRIHWVCVPLIMWAALGMLWAASPIAAFIAVGASLVFYWSLSPRIAIAMLLASAVMVMAAAALGTHALRTSVAVFVAAWIGQFIGHRIERRKPAFLEDVRSFLVAPAWLVGDLLRRLGIGY